MFTGVKLYAAIGLLVLIAGLAGWGYIEHQRAQIAEKDAEDFKRQRDDLRAVVVQDEKEKKELVDRAEATDAIVAAQRETERKLQDEKAQVWEQFDRVIASTPEADQGCARRDLPPSVSEWLRDDGPGGDHPVPAGQDPGKPSPAVPGK